MLKVQAKSVIATKCLKTIHVERNSDTSKFDIVDKFAAIDKIAEKNKHFDFENRHTADKKIRIV